MWLSLWYIFLKLFFKLKKYMHTFKGKTVLKHIKKGILGPSSCSIHPSCHFCMHFTHVLKWYYMLPSINSLRQQFSSPHPSNIVISQFFIISHLGSSLIIIVMKIIVYCWAKQYTIITFFFLYNFWYPLELISFMFSLVHLFTLLLDSLV